jgi:septal ring factor EnvC (AmiA/AmiB activator)
MRGLLFLLLLSGFFVWSFGVHAEEEEERLRGLGEAIEENAEQRKKIRREDAQLNKEIKRLRDRSVELARKGSALEKEVSSLHEGLERLGRQQQRQLRELTSGRRDMARIVSILRDFYERPVRSYVLYPGSRRDALLAEAILRHWVPLLQRHVDEVEEGFMDLSQARQETRRQLEELTRSNESLRRQREALSQTVKSKNVLLARRREEMGLIEQRLVFLSREAGTLQELIDEIRILQRPPSLRREGLKEAEKKEVPPGVRPFPVRGYIGVPSVGNLEGAGERGHERAIRIVTLKDAQVVAPFDGKVVHAGGWGRFGNLIVIEHVGSFHSILWGLNRVSVSRGQWVLSGEPLGFVGRLGKSQRGVLNMQLRRNEEPVDPLRWFDPRVVELGVPRVEKKGASG